MIDIVEGENLMNHISEFDGIVIGTNCYQVMRNGFPFEISQKFPQIKEAIYRTKYGDVEMLGTIFEDKLLENINYILSFITFGYNLRGDDKCFLNYEALIKICKLINVKYKGKHLASTLLGSSKFDGNGDKKIILNIINRYLTDVDFTIFDYPQICGDIIKQKKFLKEKKYDKRN